MFEFGSAEVGRIRDVEYLRADLQRLVLADAEHAKQAHVHVRSGRTAPFALPEFPNRTSRHRSVRADVEILRVCTASPKISTVPSFTLSANCMRRSRRVEHGGVRRHGDQRAGRHAEERVHLPAARDLRQHAAVVEPPLAAAEWQLVDQRRVQPVRRAGLSLVEVVVLRNRDVWTGFRFRGTSRSFSRRCTPP